MEPHDARQMVTALHEGKGGQALERVAPESVGVESAMNGAQITGEAIDRLAVEQRLERVTFADRAGSRRQAK
jgi:hypothetical protein